MFDRPAKPRRAMIGTAYGVTGPVVAGVSYEDVRQWPKRAMTYGPRRDHGPIVWVGEC